MKRLALVLAFSLATAASAGKSECKSQCVSAKTACEEACRNPQGAGKTKKGAADCINQMCAAVVKQCESGCGNGKK